MHSIELTRDTPSRLVIDRDALVIDRGDGPERLVIEIAGDARLAFCGLALSEAAQERAISRTIRLNGPGASAAIGYVLAGVTGAIRADVSTEQAASDTSADIRTLCFVRGDATVDLDAGIVIEPGIARARGHLREDHVFVGSGGKIRGVPRLDVRSSDVEASHALRIERISDERIFALRNRGLAETDARTILSRGLVRDAYSSLGLPDDLLESLENDIFSLLFA